jgi:hypothetical protein
MALMDIAQTAIIFEAIDQISQVRGWGVDTARGLIYFHHHHQGTL